MIAVRQAIREKSKLLGMPTGAVLWVQILRPWDLCQAPRTYGKHNDKDHNIFGLPQGDRRCRTWGPRTPRPAACSYFALPNNNMHACSYFDCVLFFAGAGFNHLAKFNFGILGQIGSPLLTSCSQCTATRIEGHERPLRKPECVMCCTCNSKRVRVMAGAEQLEYVWIPLFTRLNPLNLHVAAIVI